MKKLFTVALLVICIHAEAQIGIGTTSPNSTLDIRGSLSNAVTAFTTNTTAGNSDNLLLFTGTSATTLTLPTAAGITGREYWVKNVSSNSSVLTIATASSQTIDGLSSWTLTQTNKAIRLVSNGANWYAAAESLPGSTGTPWVHGGNNVTSQQNLGTTSNYALPFITNNTEKMRLTTSGSLGIGTSTFNATYPEKLLVDAGTTTSVNAIVGKGTIDSYLQLNIQNNSAGNSASSDVVATANNGSETANYIDMGINSSTYNLSTFTITGINDAYLYSTGNDLAIGNATSNKAIKFFTAGTLAANERMRINHLGNIAIGTSTWDGSNPEKLLIDAGTTSSVYPLSMKGTMNGWFQTKMTNSSTGTSASADFLAANSAGAFINMGMNGTGYTGSGMLSGGSKAYLWTNGGNDFTIGNASASKYLAFFTGGQSATNERMRIDGNGNVGIGTTTFNVTNPEKLVVDAGTTTSVNAIVGKGSINSYLQLNIQNLSNGTGASSDVVATADNGSETTNYIDMGINSSTNNSGVFGGANDAYLYNVGQNLLIGTSTAAKSLVLMTGGTSQSTNERMRIDGTGNVGIGTTNPSYKLHVLAASNPLYLLGVQTGANTDSILTITNGIVKKLHPSATSSWIQGGNNVASMQNIGTTSNYSLPFITNNTEKMRLTSTGSLGIGTSTFNATYPEKLIVDAGSTGNTNYQNVIVGKGNTNSYAQLNIQNNSSGTAASSDVVATANNGSETVNFIDMGINGGGNTSAGVLGGANTAYIYATGNDFVIGNSTENKDLIFYTTVPTATSTERMRVTGTGVKVSGSVTVGYRSGTGNYTLLTTDYVVINTGAAVTWTLPAASSCAGKMYRLLNHGTGNITLSIAVNTANATTTTNLAFAAGTNYAEIISDGTAWRVLN